MQLSLPPGLSCPKHRSMPALKSFHVKSYKSSLIINLQKSFLFRIYLPLGGEKACKKKKIFELFFQAKDIGQELDKFKFK